MQAELGILYIYTLNNDFGLKTCNFYSIFRDAKFDNSRFVRSLNACIDGLHVIDTSTFLGSLHVF